MNKRRKMLEIEELAQKLLEQKEYRKRNEFI